MLIKGQLLTALNLNNAYLSKTNSSHQTVVGPVTFSSDVTINGNISLSGTLSSGMVPWARLSGVPVASTSASGIVQLNNSYTSSSTTQAATANMIKTVYDLIDSHKSSSGAEHHYINQSVTTGSNPSFGSITTTLGDHTLQTVDTWGTWSRSFSIKRSNGEILGAFGGYGSSGSTITYLYIGNSYTSPALSIDPVAKNVVVGNNLITQGTINGATISGGTLSGGTVSGGTWNATKSGYLNQSVTTSSSPTFSNLTVGSINSSGDIVITKDNAWLTLDSSNVGGDPAESAGISIGESGHKGNAALHLTYTGDGYGHIGMGAVNATTSLPAYEAIRLHYTDNNVKMLGSLDISGDIFGNSKTAIRTTDGWLRLNPSGDFASGTYSPKGIRGDGGLASGSYSLVGGEVRADIFRGKNSSYYVRPDNTSTAGLFAGPIAIGTTSTVGLLTLAVSGGSSITASANNSAIRIEDSSTGISARHGISWMSSDKNNTIAAIEPYVNGNWPTDLNFYLATSVTNLQHAMVLKSGGKLGIGTTSPAEALDVAGNARFGPSNSSDASVELWRGTSASWKALVSGGPMKIQCNWTTSVGSYFDVFTLQHRTGNAWFKGNVDVGGSSTISGDLNVSGSITQNGASGFISSNSFHVSDPGPTEGLIWNGGNGWKIVECPDNQANSGGNLQAIQGSTRRMTVRTDGRVDSPGGFMTGDFEITYDSTSKCLQFNFIG